jgi:hypothetical protein
MRMSPRPPNGVWLPLVCVGLLTTLCCACGHGSRVQNDSLAGSHQTANVAAREIARKAFPSVVLLLMEDAGGQPLSLGSGFFVRPKIVVTNVHVVKGAAMGYAKLVGQQEKYPVAGILAGDPQTDLVLLSIEKAGAPELPLADSASVSVGDDVYAVGNPEGLEGTFSQGVVSGIRRMGDQSLFQITAAISPGSSGGPVLNEQGRVIAIATATFEEGQNLNFAVPSQYLAPLLSHVGPAESLSAWLRGRPGTPGLASSGRGNSEAVAGTEFIWGSWDLDSHTLSYSFSIRNLLTKSVTNVYCLVVFYDAAGKPVDADEVRYDGTLLPGSAKRLRSTVDSTVYGLSTYRDARSKYGGISTRVEFRVLDFRIAD